MLPEPSPPRASSALRSRSDTEATTVEDAALVVAARAGDRDAFDRVARRHVGALVAAARRLLRDLGEAEEAAADALVRAHGALHRLTSPAHFGGWVHRIVLRVALDRLRARRRSWAREGAGGNALASAPDPRGVTRGPASSLGEREAVERVRAAVDALPEGQRVAIVLHVWEGLPYPEIAVLLGTSYDAVRVAVAHARRRLRARLLDVLEGDR